LKIHAPYTVDGDPILGTYAVSDLADLELVDELGMNVVLGGHDMLDTSTPVGGFLQERGIKVLHHLTRHIYGRPTLGDMVGPDQREMPLSTRPAKPLEAPGVVLLDDELVKFEEFTPGALKGCERGYGGTEPAVHNEGMFVFSPDECAEEVEETRSSPNLLGYYVLDDSPGDCISALRGIYRTVWEVDGGPDHHVVCAGYGSGGALTNFGPGVCDLMMLYWYPVDEGGYDREMTGRETQWLLTEARARVPGIPFAGIYQSYWGGGALEPTPAQLRQQLEDFVREGACGLVSFACRIREPMGGWASSESLRGEIARANEEILSTGGLEVPSEPTGMAEKRIQPTGFWDRPGPVPGVIPAWRVAAPFDNSDGKSLDAGFPPEKTLDLDTTYPGKFGPIHWIERPTVAGYVGLGELYGAQNLTSYCVAYATCTVSTPVERHLRMLGGADDEVVIWQDGVEIYRHRGVRGIGREDDSVPVGLREGSTRFLVKVCNLEGMWGFVYRFVEEDGGPAEGLDFSA